MRIAVTTPTGHVGSRVVRMLVQVGVRPVLLLRDPGKLDADLLDLVDTRQGSLADGAIVRDATTGADVPSLRCGYFFSNLLMDLDSLRGGVVTTFDDPAAPQPWVDPRDIGDVAAARLLAADWSGTLVQAVHGPADLTWTEIAATLGAVTGRPFRLAVVPPEDARDGMVAAGMPPGAAAGTVAMTTGLRSGFVPEQPRSVLSTTPTTFGAWAWANLREALLT